MTSLCVSPDGKLLLSAGQIIKMWDLDTKEIYRVCCLFIQLNCSHIVCVWFFWLFFFYFPLTTKYILSWFLYKCWRNHTLKDLCQNLISFWGTFVTVLPTEVHRPLYSCDDPALCHHATTWQQWSLFPLWCCAWSPAQCLVSTYSTAGAHIWLSVMF